MKYLKSICAIISLGLLATTLRAAEANGSIYHQELKALREAPFYKTILDRRSNDSLRQILTATENAQELSFWGRCFRTILLQQGGVVITEKEMPKLYGYLDTICKQQHMRTPTLFLTTQKSLWSILSLGKFYETNSTKILTSSGAILISQDLIAEISEKALEAAVAHELAHIKYNHDNISTSTNWIVPSIASYAIGRILPGDVTFKKRLLIKATTFLLPYIILAKQFEKEADRFVYQTTNNADGLIEFCKYLQKKDARNEADYADTSVLLGQANLGFFTYLYWATHYGFTYAGHTIHNLHKWLCLHTFFTPYQSNEARIRAAQQYLDTQKNIAAQS